MKYTFNKRLIFLVTVMAVQAFAAERSPMEYRGRGRAYAGRGSGSAATAYAERALSDTDDTPELSPAYRVCILGIREGVLKSREARNLFSSAFQAELGPVRTVNPVYRGMFVGGSGRFGGTYALQPDYTLNENDTAYKSKLAELRFQAFIPLLDKIKETIIDAVTRAIVYICPEEAPFLHPEIEIPQHGIITKNLVPADHTRDAFIQWICDDIKNANIMNIVDQDYTCLPPVGNHKEFVKFTSLLYKKISEMIENNINDLADFGAPHPLKNITVHAKGRALKERLLAAIE